MKKIFYTPFDSPIGRLYIFSTDKGICQIAVSVPTGKFKEIIEINSKSSLLKNCSRQLENYFNGKRKAFTIPLDFLEGTEFQKEVWKVLRKIPYGQTLTYKAVALKIRRPKACRAVGNAVGKNPVPIIIPCHRVVREGGRLGGFALGIKIKKKLLKLEGVL